MKKLFYAFALSTALVFTSCEQEVTVDDATIQQIVDAAVAAALANYPDYPDTQAIADAAAAAATAAVAAGLGDIDSAIQDAIDAADALVNPPLVRIGTGGITEITQDTTWEYGNIYIMEGKIVVASGATLTIEPGTIVKAAGGQGANATVLIVARGGKINAAGTADMPIIFTDIADEISYVNNGVSPNRNLTDRGKWGSIVLLGSALVGEDGGTEDIEGIVSGYDFTEYGGTNDADNSGVMQYVSIRHTGTLLAAGDELQGLTMGGVGSGTTIENIELLGSADDGIEIFGGSVDVTNLVVAYHKDDGIDLDEAYTGTISNAVVLMAADSDTVFENDGTEDSTKTIDGAFTITGVTAYGSNDAEGTDTLGDWKSGCTAFIDNVLFVNFKADSHIEGVDKDTYVAGGTAAVTGELSFKDLVFVGGSDVTRTTLTTDVKSHSDEEWTAAEKADWTWLTVSASRPASAGADESVFSWTQIYN